MLVVMGMMKTLSQGCPFLPPDTSSRCIHLSAHTSVAGVRTGEERGGWGGLGRLGDETECGRDGGGEGVDFKQVISPQEEVALLQLEVSSALPCLQSPVRRAVLSRIVGSGLRAPC